jgi:protein TonB
MAKTIPGPPARGARTLLACTAFALLTACQPRPTEVQTDERPGPDAAVQAPAQDLSAAPVYIPFTVAPVLVNRQEVIEASVEGYPRLLRDAGIGGTVRVQFYIDAEGAVRNALVQESSGHRALDRAATDVAEIYRFRPAMNDTEVTPVWISLPITFQPS